MPISLDGLTILLAAAGSLGLAGVVLGRRTPGWLPWTFGLGMIAFAAESLASFGLLEHAGSALERLLWRRLVEIAGLLVPVAWGFFAIALVSPKGRGPVLPVRLVLIATGVLAVAGSAAVVRFPIFELRDLAGGFSAAQLTPVGVAIVGAQLVATMAVLVGFEAAFRSSQGASRWRLKYLLLGLGAIFLVRFYLLSDVLFFNTLMARHLTMAAATLFLGNLVISASLTRDRLMRAEVSVSRRLIYRSAMGGILGIYLVIGGGLGWVLKRLGPPEALFWGSVVLIASALSLAIVLLSENVRWRIKRFIGLNFYRSKYDYREQWTSFARRLHSLVTLEELAPQLLAAVTDAVGTPRGVLYLADITDGRYHLAGALWVIEAPPILEADSPIVTRLKAQTEPILFDRDLVSVIGTDLAGTAEEGAVAVPLPWRGALTGFMVIGVERTGAPYTQQDLEFLTTVAQQAASAIVTALLSEKLAQSREFEAFHRLTSFVVHDIKNSISALSMLSQNALRYFDEPEFQRDAVKTISRTLERMKALLAKLSAAPQSPPPLKFQLVDLAALATAATDALAGAARVNIHKELVPVELVLGDPEALLHVLQNVVTNAVQALDGRGAVTVRTYQDDGSAVVSVTDTGCGMSDEYLRKSLFTPFRSTKKDGWGIGLSHAKSVVEAHGGAIAVRSKEGEGTTFWVRIPTAGGAQPEAPR